MAETPETLAHLLLVALFVLTVGHLVTLKICSVSLDHRTAPLFISGWSLFGLLLVSPLYGHLLQDGAGALQDHPWLLGLALFKGGLLYVLLVTSQKLMKVSLSSRHYVTPLAVGLIAVTNHFFGEHLTWQEWASALGLCALASAFFFRGHLSDLPRDGRLAYAQLVGISVVLALLDHVVLSHGGNWYTLLLISNLVLLGLSLGLHRKDAVLLKTAVFHRSAMLAGFFYAATDIVKFYQQVTINPVTAVVTVQAATKPVILLLSALIWKERTVREQLVWGCLAFTLVVLPYFFGK